MAEPFDYKRCSVLYVDDEEHSLKYFTKTCQGTFDVLTASGGEEALALIAEKGDQIAILMTDQRMPGKSGVDILGAVRKSHPKMIRILTTAYSDLESAIEAVNSGAIYKYVVKPWRVLDLQGMLKRAMEFYLVQQERDTLLREKMSVLQRLVVTDRVRSLAAMAAGLAHHIRNSMQALTTFLDIFSRPGGEFAVPGPRKSDLSQSLWGLAQGESQRILSLVVKVAEATVDPSYRFDIDADLKTVLQRAAAIATEATPYQTGAIEISVSDELPTHRTEDNMTDRLFAQLMTRARKLGYPTAPTRVTAGGGITVRGAPGMHISISVDGEAWTDEDMSSLFTAFSPSRNDPSEIGLDLLSAFFICYHHGGDIIVRPKPPEGPGFEVLLPYDPEAVERPTFEENCLEKLLTRFEQYDLAQAMQ